MTTYILAAAAVAVILVLIRYPFWRPARTGVTVLAYHHVGVPPKNSKLKRNWVSPQAFARQMDYVVSQGFTTLTLDDLAKISEGKADMPAKPLLITFDDGYKNNYLNALPILKERNLKANIFFVYDAIGHHNMWHAPAKETWQDMMTVEQIKEVLAGKNIGYGSHTLTHKNLDRIAAADAKYEIEESKFRLEALLGTQCTSFTYTYRGGKNAEINKIIKEAGYKFAFSMYNGINTPPFNADKPLNRIFIKRCHNMWDFKIKLNRR
ncbi:peptidoglycan/xylan/chitin deacetylase (PgdA/CDA1 family) [Elusimicrobium simillimum]|uniref:polysaccharide deacetylase family protein n=1 Tax=Elusimicrobium simillimum TaxID=3143438 RepID=UPI003C6F1596